MFRPIMSTGKYLQVIYQERITHLSTQTLFLNPRNATVVSKVYNLPGQFSLFIIVFALKRNNVGIGPNFIFSTLYNGSIFFSDAVDLLTHKME
mmetsp:Transcript_34238/g.50333  ORF Transcript_34238/g.50333 Transcript_34238/m.50333 type:complete len:93 (+) Transcript_34238:27-305(+)